MRNGWNVISLTAKGVALLPRYEARDARRDETERDARVRDARRRREAAPKERDDRRPTGTADHSHVCAWMDKPERDDGFVTNKVNNPYYTMLVCCSTLSLAPT